MVFLSKNILACLMWMASKAYPYTLSERLCGYRDALYTMWIRYSVGHVGKNVKICKPCCLQGDGQDNITIGDNTEIQKNSVIGCWKEYGNQSFEPSIVIGHDCRIGGYNQISSCKKITIGDGLLTGRFVYIGDNAHGGLSWDEASIPPAERALNSKGEIKIGNNVWIGDKVTILGNVTIGDNVIIGANAVVTHDVPSNCVAAGNPAKIVKRLNDDRKS